MYKISQRRYLGNKNSILDFIDAIIKTEIGDFDSMCDMFCGTGVVGAYFNAKNKKIISNDLLHNNYVSLKAFLDPEAFDESKLLKIIEEFNSLSIESDNYFSNNFANKYFSLPIARKIGYIREQIRSFYMQNKINSKEKDILLTSLMYSVDKIANTVGHYDSYIKNDMRSEDLVLKMLDIDIDANAQNRVYNKDANILIKDIECDILYLDPPYNSRQYCDSYHLLENLSLWNKPEVFGTAKKFDRKKIKSEYSKRNAADSFDELIQNARCKYILLSYNNMGEKGAVRSNAKISDDNIIRSMSKRGEVKIFEKEYKAYTSGSVKHKNNKERVYFIEIM